MTEQHNPEEVFICRHCGNRTSHTLITRHSITVPLGIRVPDTGEELTGENYFFLFECRTCKGISLKNIFSEELDYDNTFADIPFDKITYLFPTAPNFETVPEGLSLVIDEANKVKTISSLAYLILIRKVLEEICRDKDINGRNLKDKLTKLVDIEKLPIIFSEAVDKLRLLGNIGAHESRVNINRSDVELIEGFIVALIDYLYVMPSKLNKLGETLKRK